MPALRVAGPTEPEIVARVTAKRAAVVSSVAELISLAVKAPKRNRRSLDVLWDLCDDLMVRCKELCEMGLDYAEAERFARATIVRCDRKRWLDDELFG